jgi:hypothetical protein
MRVDADRKFGPDVLLTTSDPNKPLRVDLVRDSREAAFSLKAGEAITVGCRRMEENTGPDPWLMDCRIQEAARGSLSTSTASSDASRISNGDNESGD